MIQGIGLDIVELDRIARLDGRNAKFRERILSERELQTYETLSGHRKTEYLAGRFAAKEAFSKARGTGIGADCSFLDIEVIPETGGRPVLYFRKQLVRGFISITHTQTAAAAQVVLMES
ncbi:holo-[acyl-carrier-protein] synthase [Sporosarcina sp. P37]|uniref:holo-ACP synthase n=1 Tax=unclassified Sporosarcina TaxID=2647733 RepID=UPI000A17A4A7|nr:MULTISPECIES: holo-ACP synthase [unclassified Sporosarcina]ARK24532.1 holo-[acyl-carrier-protein] synthase [Sporosarcina sp. P37]PID19689.1 holo-[acyl-carrier-protein] synthase [Sporosarcina sp. P35]